MFVELDKGSQERIVDLFLSSFNNQITKTVEVLQDEDETAAALQNQLQERRQRRAARDSLTSNASMMLEDDSQAEIIMDSSGSVINQAKERISRYSFLVCILMTQLENVFQDELKASTTRGHGTSGSSLAGNRRKPPGLLTILNLIGTSLDSVSQAFLVLASQLAPHQPTLINRLYSSSTECDIYVGMFLKPVYLFMESEVILKDARGVRQQQLFRVICLAVVKFNQIQNAQTSLDQLFLYFEHTAEPLADLLCMLYSQYDNTILYEEIIKGISTREFNSNDNKGPKAVAAFISKLVRLSPRLVLKQFTYISRLLESMVFTIRSTVVEAAGIILFDICKDTSTDQPRQASVDPSGSTEGSDVERHSSAIQSLFDLLEERVLDISPYTRLRAVQALSNLTELKTKFNKRRPRMTDLAVQALEDKSSFVRRASMRLLSRLISTHPFQYFNEDGRLNLSVWQKKLKEVQEELDKYLEVNPTEPVVEEGGDVEMTEAEGSVRKPASRMQSQITSPPEERIEGINKLQMTLTYHKEAVAFITTVHKGLELAQKLLNSKNKTETIESMDLFVLADGYGIETARAGVRTMIHLVWAKGGGNNDEALAIQKRLLSCYQTLFFDPPANVSPAEANNIIARSLISLTYSATVSEAASLERLLGFAMKPTALATVKTTSSTQSRPVATAAANDPDNSLSEITTKELPTERMVSDGVITVLWKIFGYNQPLARSQRRGAIIILGMLAKEDPSVVSAAGLEILLRVGLGTLGRADFKLAKFACIALQRMVSDDVGTPEQQAKSARQQGADSCNRKFAATHEVIRRLASFIVLPSKSMEWFAVCEEAINAIYAICDVPDAVLSHLIRLKTKQVFSPKDPCLETDHNDVGLQFPQVMEGVDGNSLLAQLLFIAGHTALKTLVYLEKLEGQFKRRKMDMEREQVEAQEAAASAAAAAAAAAASAKGRRGRRAQQQQPEEMTQEQEFNLIGGGTTEDDFSENLVYIRESELMFEQQSLLSRFGPLAHTLCMEIINDIQKQADVEAHENWKRSTQRKLGVDAPSRIARKEHSKMLIVSATLSLAKMMCVSAQFCEENLGVLLTILERTSKHSKAADDKEIVNGDEDGEAKEDHDTAAIVRSNIILGMGDLAVQFNHVLEDNMQYVYKRLRDRSKMVQRTTLLTLTFLILAGQVKAKDQQLLGQMARCLEDSDVRIANLAHIFFLELGAKDNAIYNNFIDILNYLIGYTRKAEEIARREGDDPNDVSVSHSSIQIAAGSVGAGGAGSSAGGADDASALRRSSRRSDIHNGAQLHHPHTRHHAPVNYREDESGGEEEVGDEEALDSEGFQPLTKESLHRILKFLVSLVDKERYIKQLADKLSKRLEKCDTKPIWEYFAYVLTLLPHKNEDITKLVDAGFHKVTALSAAAAAAAAADRDALELDEDEAEEREMEAMMADDE